MFIYLFVVYLQSFSVSENVYRRMKRRYVNYEWERTRKEAVVIYF
jgi:hypothetical protein